MNRRALLKTELKSALKAARGLLIGAIVLMTIIGTVAFCAQKILYGDQVVAKINIGMVTEGESYILNMALNLLERSESVKNNCQFIYLDKAEAMTQLEEGRLSAVMLVPETMADDIISGKNTPVQVIFGRDNTVEAEVLQLLTQAGARTLSAAQAGIYTVYDLYTPQKLEQYLPEAELSLNQSFLIYALNRSHLFSVQKTSATGALSVRQYYEVSALVLFLFLFGMCCGGFIRRNNQALSRCLVAKGIGRMFQMITHMLAAALIYLVLLALAGGGLFWFEGIHLYYVVAFLPVAVVVAAIMVLLYELAPTQSAGMLLIFVLSLVMMAASGGLVPLGFLPEGLRYIGKMLPTYWMMTYIGSLFSDLIHWTALIFLMLWGGICLIIAGVIDRLKAKVQ